MSNMISFDGYTAPDDDSLVMSNGGTDVFISIPALSGAGIARTESGKRLMVFLSERDQIIGGGCVGFEIVEMPWDRGTFEADKRFLTRVIQGARSKCGWERLDYCPNEEIMLSYLDRFEKLIRRMTVDDIREDSLARWLAEAEEGDPVFCRFPICQKHHIFLTCFGCQICNH